MNENDYNERLKYPLNKFQNVDSRVVAESTSLLGCKIFEDLINSEILDAIRAADINFTVIPSALFVGDFMHVAIPRQDLNLPHQQLIEYYITPILKTLTLNKKHPIELSFSYSYTDLGVVFQLGVRLR